MTAISLMSLLVTLVVIVMSIACAPSSRPTPPNSQNRGVGEATKSDSVSKRLEADTNKNGTIDAVSYWDSGRLIRIEIDQDEDGKVDRWEHFDADNKIHRIGSSSRDDQTEDTWTYPDAAGFLVRVEMDGDRDGDIDKREIYKPRPNAAGERVLSVVEFDLDAAGTPSRRLYYKPDGSFDRVEKLR